MRLLSSALPLAVALLSCSVSVQGFVCHRQLLPQQIRHSLPCPLLHARKGGKEESSSLLDEFRLYNGELLDPYKILKVSKKAERAEIRKKYIDLSRRYHPDAAMHRDILPGSCNNEDDVRLEWERIKMSYEILSNRKMRTRYDRNVVIADPKAAMQRAAMEAAGGAAAGVASYVGKGVFAVGKGLFSMGAKVVSESMNKKEPEKKDDAAKA